MKLSLRRRTLVCAVAATLAAASMSSTFAAEPAAKADEQKSKIGLLAAAGAVASIYTAFVTWMNNRVPAGGSLTQAEQPTVPVMFVPVLPANSAPVAAPLPAAPMPSAATTAPLPLSPYYSTTPIILGQPDVPFNALGSAFNASAEWSANYNYQGVQVAVIVLDSANRPAEVRSLNAPFRSGERFKLRLLSTFEARASIDAYQTLGAATSNYVQPPAAWVGQIYPARFDQVVQLRAGDPVLLPLGANEYFTFDNRPGLDRLVLNVRHPQANATQTNTQPVYRQDTAQGSTYLQLAVGGSYPAFSQMIALQHNP